MPEPRIIYDFGSNNGDDIPYYLQKADKVVAVEANPDLVAQIVSRFSRDIAAQRLVVENCVLTVAEVGGLVPFFVHKRQHVLSQFPRPDEAALDSFEEVMIPSKNVIDLIAEHGSPFYVKVDLESYDQVILMELFQKDIRPKFISAESHSIEVFAVLVALGHYPSFNLVDGGTVHTKYSNHPITTLEGMKSYSFPNHSAGPFGEDIKGPWMTPDQFFRRLAIEQLGWRDIHATTEIPPNPDAVALYSMSVVLRELASQAKETLRIHAPAVFKALKTVRLKLAF